MDYTGTTVGNYILVQLLGSGGFAPVYLAKHTLLPNIQVAVKLMSTAQNEQSKQAFLTEARLVTVLKHPNIIQVFDFGFEPVPYLVMELAAKGTLLDRHPKGSVVPLDLVVAYVRQIAAALQWAHDNKYIHQDVKPANILVRDDDSIALGDFGISTIVKRTQSLILSPDQLAHLGSGTPTYMAPEQTRGEPKQASDQYALGVVTYEWLCGTVPFTGNNAFEMANKHRTESPMSLVQRTNGRINPVVSEVISRALAKNPEDRFSHVEQFAEALWAAALNTSKVWGEKRGLLWFEDQSNPDHTDHAPTGTVLQSFPGLEKPFKTILALDWSPTGKQIVVGGGTGIYVRDVLNGELVDTFEYKDQRVRTLAISPNGAMLASLYDDQTFVVWSMSSIDVIFKTQCFGGPTTRIIWSPDSKFLAVVGSNGEGVQAWNILAGRQVARVAGGIGPMAVRWLPSGVVAIAAGIQRDVHIGDTRTRTSQQVLESPFLSKVEALAWSPDGQLAAVASLDSIAVWDTRNGEVLGKCIVKRYPEHEIYIKELRFSPNGTMLACLSNWHEELQVWTANLCKCAFAESYVYSSPDTVAWSPDSARIASVKPHENIIRIWQSPIP